MTEIEQLRHELAVTDHLLEQLTKMWHAIPECPVHGHCIPYAIDWIEKHKESDIKESDIKESDAVEEVLKPGTWVQFKCKNGSIYNYQILHTDYTGGKLTLQSATKPGGANLTITMTEFFKGNKNRGWSVV